MSAYNTPQLRVLIAELQVYALGGVDVQLLNSCQNCRSCMRSCRASGAVWSSTSSLLPMGHRVSRALSERILLLQRIECIDKQGRQRSDRCA